MKAKDFIPASKPRNPVVRQQQTSGAGAHRDKKKEQKQGYEKHKGKDVAEGMFGLDPEIKGKIQNIVTNLSDVPGNWDHNAQEFTPAGLEELKTALHNKPKYIKYALSLTADDFDEGSEMEGRRDYGYDSFGNSLRPGDDEGSTEPPNNFAIYINGKKWKVFQGKGQYADDAREKKQHYDLKAWAHKKSQETGKKWEVYITGEPATK